MKLVSDMACIGTGEPAFCEMLNCLVFQLFSISLVGGDSDNLLGDYVAFTFIKTVASDD